MFQNQQNNATSDGTKPLLEKARSGDRNALGELIGQHYHLVRRTAYRILRNAADAEDVTQEVCLKVFCKLHTFESQAAFSTWLTRIAINESLMFLRKSRRMALFHIDDTVDCESASSLELPAPAPCPEQQCVANDELNRLYGGIKRLPPNLGGVLSDQVFLDLPLIEIAKRRGLSVSAVKARAHRAQKILSRTLNTRHVAMRAAI